MSKQTIKKNEILFDILRKYNSSATDSTLNAYVSTLTKVYKDMGHASDKDYPVDIIKDPKKVIDVLRSKGYLDNTMKNKLSAIISYLLACGESKKVIIEYTDAVDSFAGKIGKEQSKMQWNEKDDNNKMNIDDLHKYVDTMYVNLPKNLKRFKDILMYQLYLCASFQLSFAPRNELCDAKLYTVAEFDKVKDSNDENYIIVNPKTKHIKVIYNVFKTKASTAGGQISFEVKDDEVMAETFLKYLKGVKEYYSDSNDEFDHWFLFNEDRKKLTRNDYTRLLQKAFKGTGKTISSSLIRKIVASDLIDVDKLKKNAYIEGHSVKTMLNTYVKS
jgi:hypothetical protein